MKFIYFYSDLYEYYNNHISKNTRSIFDVDAIKIDNLKNNGGHTFFGGVSIKIELIIQKIKENMGNSIVFTDATIFINSNNTNELLPFFEQYIENDLCFANNGGDMKYNIGIILIKCTTNTLTFFETVLTDLKKTDGWDQDIVNKNLCNSNLKINTFDSAKIVCGWEFSNNNTFLIFKSFINHDKNIFKNFNKRLDIFKTAGLITNEEYNMYRKDE